MIQGKKGSLGMSASRSDEADALIKAAAEEHKDICASLEAMRVATEQINETLQGT
jgi:hypothetical protein